MASPLVVNGGNECDLGAAGSSHKDSIAVTEGPRRIQEGVGVLL